MNIVKLMINWKVKMTKKEARALRKLNYTKRRGCFGVMTNADLVILVKLGFFLNYRHDHYLEYEKRKLKKGEVRSKTYYFQEPPKTLRKLIQEAKNEPK